jgi:hypothetical protein
MIPPSAPPNVVALAVVMPAPGNNMKVSKKFMHPVGAIKLDAVPPMFLSYSREIFNISGDIMKTCLCNKTNVPSANH